MRSPFGSISRHGHAGAQRLLDEHDAEARLARAGHADDHPVGGEVGGIERDGRAAALVGGRVDELAEAEVAMAANVALAAPRTVRVMAFRGFPPEAIAFYEGLEADNSKGYWQANKAIYEEAVKAPMEALSPSSMPSSARCGCSVPYRDVRFSKDKSPYKTAAAAPTARARAAPATTCTCRRTACWSGRGCYHMAPDQLARFREAVDDERTGTELERLVAVDGEGRLRHRPRTTS